MKIIGVSNFDNETTNDILICENISPEFDKVIVNLLNRKFQFQGYFFKMVDDDYQLYKFEP